MNLSEQELVEAIARLDAQYAGDAFPQEARDRWNELNEQLEEKRKRRERIAEIHRSHAAREGEHDVRRTRARAFAGVSTPKHLEEARSEALRAIDRNSDALDNKAATRLEQFIEQDISSPAGGVDARFIAAMGDLDYASAFGKMLGDPMTAHLRMTPDEQMALQRANKATAERAMSEGTSSAGGYGVPVAWDPTIVLSSTGTNNPIRQLATTRTMTTNELRVITSAGVTASWDGEGVEVSDDSPTLAQPVLYAEKAAAFVPFSIELGQDYATLQQELRRLMLDAKDVLEGTAFLSGLGHASNQPQGILVGAASVTVTTASTAVYAIGDVYTLLQAIPARFQPNASFIASPTILDQTYQFVGYGSTVPPVLLDRGGNVLGRSTYEWSDMATATTSGSTIVLAGDVGAAYSIGDRIGATAELVPHLFATANNRPSGSRGIYFHWRVAGAVVNEAAIRVLKTK